MTRATSARSPLKAFTDYPLEGATGVVEVQMLAYDRNKYATVRFGAQVTKIKAGYLYRDPALTRCLARVEFYSLPVADDAPTPSRRQACRELKARRRKKTTYTVRQRCFTTLRAAAKALARCYLSNQEANLWRERGIGGSWSNAPLLEIERDPAGHLLFWYCQNRKGRCVLKRRRFRRLFAKRGAG